MRTAEVSKKAGRRVLIVLSYLVYLLCTLKEEGKTFFFPTIYRYNKKNVPVNDHANCYKRRQNDQGFHLQYRKGVPVKYKTNKSYVFLPICLFQVAIPRCSPSPSSFSSSSSPPLPPPPPSAPPSFRSLPPPSSSSPTTPASS